jgi:glycosyltransferase involved in cell wall biosynthesis
MSSPEPTAAPATAEVVSVVIPTIRRHEMLRQAVASVLSQALPDGWSLEVVIAVSDSSIEDDVAFAERLAAEKHGVVVALGPGHGSGATRNAGVRVASGSVLAFIDDDCVAAPGWLKAALTQLGDADIVQGATTPQGDVPPYHHSIRVTPPSWLWETCNLLVRREALERAGGFNEGWNAEGKVGNLFQFGEDAELGWKMVREGARAAWAPDAVVRHAVFPRTYLDYLRYQAGLRRFPHLFRSTPEVRRIFYHRYFVSRHHVLLTAVATLWLGAAVTAAARHGRIAGGLALAGGVAYLVPEARNLVRAPRGAVRALATRIPRDVVEFSSALYGSIRWRRILL